MKNEMLPEKREYVKHLNNGSYTPSSYTWRKGWIRPYESLYSVLRTFERLNGFSASGVFKMICNKKQMSIDDGYINDFIYCACNGAIETTHTSSKSVSEFFSTGDENLPAFPKMNDKAQMLLLKEFYVICPECHKRGYHSWMFQYRALRSCPIHQIPLEILHGLSSEEEVGVMDSHPMLYEIDTKKIDDVYHKLLLNVKSVEFITINDYFNIREYGERLQMVPLLSLGEEIYRRAESDCPDVEVEMSSRFRKVVGSVSNSIISGQWTEEHSQNILEDTFNRNRRHKKNPFFHDTLATTLQIYITLMEMKVQYAEEPVLDIIFHKYMCYVQGVYDPLKFRKLYHPYTSEPYPLRSTANVYDLELAFVNLAHLNENDTTLVAIDDHIRFQWERYRKLVMEDHIDESKAVKKLPNVAYLCMTDKDGIVHLNRIVVESVNEK